MRKRTHASLLAVAALGGGLLVGLLPAGADAASANLIKNPGAEAAAGGTGGVVTVPNWKRTHGSKVTAVKYGTGGFLSKTSPGPSSRGKNFFAGGPQSTPGSSVVVQTVSLKSFASKIDSGHEAFTISGFFGGLGGQPDSAGMEVDFRDGSNTFLDSSTIGFHTPAKTGLFQQERTGTVPAHSRFAYIQLICDGNTPGYNHGFVDNVSLTLG
jgi:hypothetical protein